MAYQNTFLTSKIYRGTIASISILIVPASSGFTSPDQNSLILNAGGDLCGYFIYDTDKSTGITVEVLVTNTGERYVWNDFSIGDGYWTIIDPEISFTSFEFYGGHIDGVINDFSGADSFDSFDDCNPQSNSDDVLSDSYYFPTVSVDRDTYCRTGPVVIMML